MRFVFSAVLLLIAIESISSQRQYESISSFFGDNNSSDINNSRIWAVLVAGSSGWENYRHQADVLHAYQLLVRRGVPRNQIITMMFDDLAHSTENPFPGQIFNVPGGPNVYSKAIIDYRKEEVTPTTFLSVLTADSTLIKQNKPVLQSNENDNVFIYFSDHGATGLIAFPEEYLYADQLQKAFDTMRQKRMYKKMVVYVEACESASMFQELPTTHNIYALTASNGRESSWSCIFNDTLGTFMADCFSINWLLNSDREISHIETLMTQYKVTLKLTNLSHVMHFGQLDILQDRIGMYQGIKNDRSLLNSIDAIQQVEQLLTVQEPVKQEHVEVAALLQQLKLSETENYNKVLSKLHKVLQKRENVLKIIKKIVDGISGDGFAEFIQSRHDQPIDFKCYRYLISHFRKQCSHIIDFKSYEVLRDFYKFHNICLLPTSFKSVIGAIDNACNVEH